MRTVRPTSPGAKRRLYFAGVRLSLVLNEAFLDR
jgi:hypothetical protein